MLEKNIKRRDRRARFLERFSALSAASALMSGFQQTLTTEHTKKWFASYSLPSVISVVDLSLVSHS
jgi:hypothetical protein